MCAEHPLLGWRAGNPGSRNVVEHGTGAGMCDGHEECPGQGAARGRRGALCLMMHWKSCSKWELPQLQPYVPRAIWRVFRQANLPLCRW